MGKPKTMCPTFLLNFVGAFIERPRANTVRPYGSSKTLINQGLLKCLFDAGSTSDGHTELSQIAPAMRVVTCTDESHHLGALVSFETH